MKRDVLFEVETWDPDKFNAKIIYSAIANSVVREQKTLIEAAVKKLITLG